MKKTLKRTLCLLLSALMTAALFTSLPLTVGAATANDESVGAEPTAYALITRTPNTSSWTTLTFRYDTNMPNNAWDVSNTDFEPQEAPWFDDNLWEYGWDDRITRIVFEPSFANARPTSTANWFYLIMNGLDEDEYPETIEGLNYLNTSCVTDMKGMFFQTSFSYLDVSDWDTSNVTDMREMFYYCESLTSLDVSTWDTGNVTDMYRMFDWCVSLNDLDVSDWDTSNVTDMHEMFDGCSGLSQLDVSSWDTSNVTDMYAMFNGCSGLSQLDVSSWDTSNVTDMYAMFGGCSGLSQLDVSSWDTSSCTDMLGMFAGCSGLSQLDVSSWDTGNVTNMYAMFNGCSGLSQLDVSTWNTGNVANMYIMFRGCNSLTSLDLSSWDISKVTNMSSMFDGCGALETIKVADKNVDWSSSTATSNNMFSGCTSLVGTPDGISFNSTKTNKNVAKAVGGYFSYEPEAEPTAYAVLNGTTLTFKYDNQMPDTNAWDVSDTSYTYRVSGRAPWHDAGVTTVVFDPSFADARPTSTAYWFYTYIPYNPPGFKSSLSSIEGISYLNTSNVTDMSGMFQGCNSLTSLDLSSWDTGNVTNMNSMFNGCDSLTSIDVSTWDTGNVTRMDYMFNNCFVLNSIDVSSWDTSKVISMNGVFDNCQNLTFLDLRSWDTSSNTLNFDMFYNCKSLETILVANKDVDWSVGRFFDPVAGPDPMFYGCTVLEGKPDGIAYAANTSSDKDLIYYAKADGGYFSYVTAYAVLDGTTLTFKYDYNMPKTNAWDVNNTNYSSSQTAPWKNANITAVVFDSSFADARPLSTAYWFYGCNQLTEIENTEYLNTENVVNMNSMFNGCSGLSQLDVSTWDTDNVTDMTAMFNDCISLKTITVADEDADWSNGSVSSSQNMFKNCTSLVGNPKGIAYDSGKTDVNYAKAVGGYFTYGSIKYFVAHNLTLKGDIGVNFGIDLHEIDPANARVTLEWYKYQTEYKGNLVPNGGLYIATANVAAKEIADTITAKLYDGETLVETDIYSVKQYADTIIKTDDLSDLGITVSSEKAAALKNLCKAMLKYGSASEMQFDEQWNHSDAHPVTATYGIDYNGYTPADIPSYETPDYSSAFAPYGIEYYGSSIGTKTTTGYLLVFKAPSGSNAPVISYKGTDIAPMSYGTNAIAYQITDIHAKLIPDDLVVTVGGTEVHFNMLAYITRAMAKGDDTLKALVAAFYDYGAKAKSYFAVSA